MENRLLNCKICNSNCNPKNSKSISRHILVKHNLTLEEYYDKFYKKENEEICIICKRKNRFDGLEKGYANYCSNKCRLAILKEEKAKKSITG